METYLAALDCLLFDPYFFHQHFSKLLLPSLDQTYRYPIISEKGGIGSLKFEKESLVLKSHKFLNFGLESKDQIRRFLALRYWDTSLPFKIINSFKINKSTEIY